MGQWRLLDNVDGVKSYHYYDDKGKKTIIKTEQDVQPLFDMNTYARNNAERGWKGDMHHVASIPFVVYEQLMREIGYDYKTGGKMTEEQKVKFMRLLSSREYYKTRTKEGRLA